MDICVLNPFFYPYAGGTEKVLLEVYRRLAKDNNITVISAVLKPNEKQSEEEICGINVIRLPSRYINIPNAPMPFLVIHGITQAVKKCDSELYHINNRYQFFPSTVKAIKKKHKLALTLHNALPKNIDLLTDMGGILYDKLWGRKVMHAADLITGVSKNTIDTTVPQREMHKAKVIYNGVDLDLFCWKNRVDREVETVRRSTGVKGARIILSNGRLTTQKGQTYLIKAVSELVADGRDVGLVIIGKGPLQAQLSREAERAGLGERFKIISGVKEEKLPYYYNMANVFALPSLYEPAGLVLLEALSCKTPVVATEIGGITEMCGSSGFYVKPKDVNGLKEKLEYVIEHAEGRDVANCAKNGRKRMVKYHDWDKIADQYENAFMEVLKL